MASKLTLIISFKDVPASRIAIVFDGFATVEKLETRAARRARDPTRWQFSNEEFRLLKKNVNLFHGTVMFGEGEADVLIGKVVRDCFSNDQRCIVFCNDSDLVAHCTDIARIVAESTRIEDHAPVHPPADNLDNHAFRRSGDGMRGGKNHRGDEYSTHCFGFKNDTNRCFLIASIQLLYSNRAFVDAIIKNGKTDSLNVSYHLAGIFQKMQKTGKKQSQDGISLNGFCVRYTYSYDNN
jgi:hypothetical protein